jgi:hypothetical protein
VIEFDITEYVNAQIGGDKVVSIVVIDDTVARHLIRFWSREGQQPPILQVSLAGDQ